MSETNGETPALSELTEEHVPECVRELRAELAAAEKYGRSADSVMKAMSEDLDRAREIMGQQAIKLKTAIEALERAAGRLGAIGRMSAWMDSTLEDVWQEAWRAEGDAQVALATIRGQSATPAADSEASR